MTVLTEPSNLTQTILVDGHVHLPSGDSLQSVLDQACQNFQAAAAQGRAKNELISVLLLAEVSGTQVFKGLKKSTEKTNQPLKNWQVRHTVENHSLLLEHQSGQKLYLIAGHQIVTQEKLEVLALLCVDPIESGLPLEQTIEAILNHQGIPVLPWGVGKWIGKRGQIIQQFLNHKLADWVYFADNGGRPIFWPYPTSLKQAQQQGLGILSGSDPLPISQDRHRAGSFGVVIQGSFNPESPAKSLRQLLTSSALSLQPYGTLQQPLRFIQNQLQLKLTQKTDEKCSVISGANTRHQASGTFPYLETADIETSSEDYASRFAGKTGAWLLQVQEQATQKMLASIPEASVLDVGGGHGQLTEMLIREGHIVTVLGSAEICKQRIQTWLDQRTCQFDIGDVLNLPYADQSFDAVISYRFLAHVTQWQTFLSELTRVAKTAVIIDYPTVRSINSIAPMLFKLKKGLEGNTRPYTSYIEQELVNHFKALHFTQTDRYAQFSLPMVVHRTIKAPRLSALAEAITRSVGLNDWLGSPVIARFTRNELTSQVWNDGLK